MGYLEADPSCDVMVYPEYANELRQSNLVLLATQGKSDLIGNIKRYNEAIKSHWVTY